MKRMLKLHPRLTASLVVALGGTLAFGAGISGAASAGSAKPGVLHFYSVQNSFSYVNAAGQQAQSPPDNSSPGDMIQFTDLDYVGTHKHHAKDWTSSDHGMCIFINANAANCYIQLAVGGSLILAQGPLIMNGTQTFPVVGGSGIFKGLTGVAASANTQPNNPNSPSDLTITLHR
jgi:hypothetical protein